MKKIAFFGLLILVQFWSSCRSDFETVPSTGNLEFSRDTVFLDTIFTNIGSATYTLKVYNRTNRDIAIPRIALDRGEESGYRLNVDGLPGKSFHDIEILSRDSIFIFIETTLGTEEIPEAKNRFLYTDKIVFGERTNLQEVPLVTLVQDAVFLYPKKNADGSTETLYFGTDEAGEEIFLKGFFLEEEQLIFTSEKPYVIYNYAAVPKGKTLTIEAGARIHFHTNSGLIVPRNASLQANGEFSRDRNLLEKEIIFQGDRLQSGFSAIPGQWGTIWLTEGSHSNSFSYTTIKNASIGLWVDGIPEAGNTPPLLLSNVQIYNSAVNGLLARRGHIDARNLVINNSGQASLHLALGGSYRFLHASIGNYWGQGYRNYPAVYIENEWESPSRILTADLQEATFSNSIIYGNQNLEILFNRNEAAEFNFRLENTLFKFRDHENRFIGNRLYDFTNEVFYNNILLNEDPLFEDPKKNNLQLTEGSAAIDEGSLPTATEVPFDLLNVDRTASPDLGAFEWLPPAREE